MPSQELTCIRCGKCCRYTLHNGQIRKCKYLLEFGKTATACRIYGNRLGTIIHIEDITENGKEYRIVHKCTLRKDNPRIIKGCPLNPPQ